MCFIVLFLLQENGRTLFMCRSRHPCGYGPPVFFCLAFGTGLQQEAVCYPPSYPVDYRQCEVSGTQGVRLLNSSRCHERSLASLGLVLVLDPMPVYVPVTSGSSISRALGLVLEIGTYIHPCSVDFAVSRVSVWLWASNLFSRSRRRRPPCK